MSSILPLLFLNKKNINNLISIFFNYFLQIFNKIGTEIYKIQIPNNYLKIINISYFF